MRTQIRGRVIPLCVFLVATVLLALVRGQAKQGVATTGRVVDVLPLHTLSELIVASESIVLGQVITVKAVPIPDRSPETYTRVSLRIDKGAIFKGPPRHKVTYQSGRPAHSVNRDARFLVFLGPERNGLALPIGINRGEFSISLTVEPRDPDHPDVSFITGTRHLWTSADPLWSIASRKDVRAQLNQMLVTVTPSDKRDAKVEKLLSIGDLPRSPDTVPLDLILAVIRAALPKNPV